MARTEPPKVIQNREVDFQDNLEHTLGLVECPRVYFVVEGTEHFVIDLQGWY